jgi:methyltransferase (TIGR00027 family)
MKENTASRTAQYMALFRALESTLPHRRRLFNDVYAISFLDSGLKLAAFVSSIPLIGSIIPLIVQNKSAGAMSAGIARTKFIDDLLEGIVRKGINQVVILGAGFDTRAQRLPFLKNVAVIEIDHPDTSAFKVSKLKETLPDLPANVRYLQIDFNKQTLGELALKSKIDLNIPTVYIWEGVTNYLPKEAIDKTFSFVQKSAKGSSIIFTYINKKVLENPAAYRGVDKVKKYLEDSDERWQYGFNPEEMPAYLNNFGLVLKSDSGAEEFRTKYMGDRKNWNWGYEFYRVAVAEVR